MLQALLAGVASIKAQQTRMNVIGNNLANVNTTAYKGSRVTFQDMIAQTLTGASAPSSALGGTNPVQFGLGVLVGATDTNNQQGSLSATNRPSDIAIQGNGYFMVSNGQTVSFTRDGAFDIDASGNLVQNSTGQRVLGWTANSLGQINTSIPIDTHTTLNIPIGRLNAVQKTTQVTMVGNLDGTAASSAKWTTQVRVYDTLGGPHDLTMTFTNHQAPAAAPAAATNAAQPAGASSSWDWSAVDSADTNVPPAVLGSSSMAGGAPLYFDQNGVYLPSTVSTGYTNSLGQTIAAGSTVTNQVIIPANLTTGTVALGINLVMSQVGQLKTTTQIAAKDQDGFPPGSLQGYSIGTDGIITGLFTNGLTRPIGQLATGIFPNPNGMERIGSNLWRATDNSGVAVVGTPATGGRGQVSSGFLEQSNVDIGSEFTDLIVTQRGFQANTKVVTTVDEMLQDLINMKR